MANVLIPIPHADFDPSEVAISWQVLAGRGHVPSFATPDGRPGRADELMLSGEGLDPWGWLPGLKRLTVLGRVLGANRAARAAYCALAADAAFLRPRRWDGVEAGDFDALLLPGGHRARGMCAYLESPVLERLVAEFFDAGKPVAAICHGVVLAARSRSRRSGRSVLYGRRTTALPWDFERKAWRLTRWTRFWDPHYYRTYVEADGQSPGFLSVQQEVTRALARPEDFVEVPADAPDRRRKLSGLNRDSAEDPRAAFVVVDGRYVSARWPGDVHTFARTFAALLEAPRA